MRPPWSAYSETDIDNDLPNSRKFNDMRAIRRNNRRKAAEALPKFTTRENFLDEIEGIMNTNLNRYYEEEIDKE